MTPLKYMTFDFLDLSSKLNINLTPILLYVQRSCPQKLMLYFL